MNPKPTHEPIRVAHLLDARHFGGAEEIARRLIRAAPASGVEARAYILSEGRLAAVLREQGLPVQVFGSSGRLDLRMIGPLCAAARRDGVQIIQAHTSRTHLIARIVSRRLGIKNITTIHSPIALDENHGTTRHPLRARIERLGRPWTDLIVTVSREERDRLIAEEHVPPARIAWIPNGADPVAVDRPAARARLEAELARCGMPTAGLRLVMIAQMRPRKGPDILLEAFARLRQSHPGTLLMIGDDSFTDGVGYLQSLKDQAARLGIAADVLFTGFMPDPWTLAAGADALVLPSRFGEGLPLVLLEAMNHALPIFTSDTTGNRELVHIATPGNPQALPCGWLHPPGDVAALAADLLAAVLDPAAAAARGELGRQTFLKHFTIARIAELYRESYRTLLAPALETRFTIRP